MTEALFVGICEAKNPLDSLRKLSIQAVTTPGRDHRVPYAIREDRSRSAPGLQNGPRPMDHICLRGNTG
jgi:hypothetical protein